MPGYIKENLNPDHLRVGDCVIRAIAKATEQAWEETYIGVAIKGLEMHDMPSANHVWGAYLKDKGFVRKHVEDGNEQFYTVEDFAHDHPQGTYVLAISGHVVCVKDGVLYDSWDSREEIPIYYFEREVK